MNQTNYTAFSRLTDTEGRAKRLGHTGSGLIAMVFAALATSMSTAQPTGHAHYQQTSLGEAITAQTQTEPDDDAVLEQAPDNLQLLFPRRVRLVKLTLHSAAHDWVDIDFRYDPQPDSSFRWRLPGLAQAEFYTADWAILGDDDQLIRGSFSFAFGPDAEPPSVARQARELLLQQRYGDPDIRYVAPPPTQIILDRDQPNYDPPFTIRLEPGNPDN
jgi:methionine-rich copper-binding protein CopC